MQLNSLASVQFPWKIKLNVLNITIFIKEKKNPLLWAFVWLNFQKIYKNNPYKKDILFKIQQERKMLWKIGSVSFQLIKQNMMTQET